MPWPALQRLKAHISSVVPSRCAVCASWPESARLCPACIHRFAPVEPRCSTCARLLDAPAPQCGACLVAPPPLDLCLAALRYSYPWSDLIGRFKFGGDPSWATSLAALLRQTPGVAQALAQADVVLAMPLHPKRLQLRGYNQAQLLAQALTGGACPSQWLLRVRDTPSQSGLGRRARQRNLQGAFSVEPLVAHQLVGRRLVLVDDVMTTGASLHAGAGALRLAGAAHITALVVARTETADNDPHTPIHDWTG